MALKYGIRILITEKFRMLIRFWMIHMAQSIVGKMEPIRIMRKNL